eukprot:2990491-Prymnesium_polylepis.1
MVDPSNSLVPGNDMLPVADLARQKKGKTLVKLDGIYVKGGTYVIIVRGDETTASCDAVATGIYTPAIKAGPLQAAATSHTGPQARVEQNVLRLVVDEPRALPWRNDCHIPTVPHTHCADRVRVSRCGDSRSTPVETVTNAQTHTHSPF